MPAFSYTALDQVGTELKGILEADSVRQVRQTLRDKGYIPLQISFAHTDEASKKNKYRFFRKATLKSSDLSLFTRQLATLLQSGLPLEQSLAAIARQADKREVSSLIMSVRSKVMEGFTLARALEEFPRSFPYLYRATVSAGEYAGYLDGILEKLADYTESVHASKQKIYLAMLYPCLLLIVAISIVLGLMIFVVPGVIEVFSDQGQTLPLMTRILVGFSDLLINHGGKVIVFLMLTSIGFYYLFKNPAFRLQWDKKILNLPIIGKLLLNFDTERLAGTLNILTASGVTLVDAIKISSDVIHNKWLKAQMENIHQQVREGSSFFRALDYSKSFPPMMVHMVASGENSGELTSMLGRIADHQQRELSGKISTMIGILEPVMLLVMGGVVLFIVMAILMPILNMNTLIA